MLHPIPCCTSCGAALGHIYMIFRAMRNEMVKQQNDGNLQYSFTVTKHTEQNLDKIFTALGIPAHKACCRGLLNANMMYEDLGNLSVNL